MNRFVVRRKDTEFRRTSQRRTGHFVEIPPAGSFPKSLFRVLLSDAVFPDFLSRGLLRGLSALFRHSFSVFADKVAVRTQKLAPFHGFCAYFAYICLNQSDSSVMTPKDCIVERTMRMFVSHGIRAVRMDDVAQQLGVSKRSQ